MLTHFLHARQIVPPSTETERALADRIRAIKPPVDPVAISSESGARQFVFPGPALVAAKPFSTHPRPRPRPPDPDPRPHPRPDHSHQTHRRKSNFWRKNSLHAQW